MIYFPEKDENKIYASCSDPEFFVIVDKRAGFGKNLCQHYAKSTIAGQMMNGWDLLHEAVWDNRKMGGTGLDGESS